MPNFIDNISPVGGKLYGKDVAGNVGFLKTVAYDHYRVALLGDSITSRSVISLYPHQSVSAIAVWNQANFLLGSPFIWTSPLAMPGATTVMIMSLIASIPSNTRLVFLMTGTNDIYNMSSLANQGTIDSNYNSLTALISAGVASMVSCGKIVVISTVIPNSAYSSDTDSRIQLLDRVNTFISGLANGTTIFVVDGFTAMWDDAQPTLRVAKTNYLQDGTHPSAIGALEFGYTAMAPIKSAVARCTPDIDIYRDFNPALIKYNAFRRSTGGLAGVMGVGCTGTIADGWYVFRLAGTPTAILDASIPYTKDMTNFIGGWNLKPVGGESFWQEMTIDSTANGDAINFVKNGTFNNTTGSIEGVCGGFMAFAEIEIDIVSQVNLGEISFNLVCYYTKGTAPVNIPYTGSYTFSSSSAGSTTDNGCTKRAMTRANRKVLRTPVFRFPENISDGEVKIDLATSISFVGNGNALLRLARPSLWINSGGRLS